MRWESLFADLEAQLESEQAAQLREEIAESIRVEKARAQLIEQLLGYQESTLSLRLLGDQEVTGRLGPVGADYLCLEEGATRWLIRLIALQSVLVPPSPAFQMRSATKVKLGAVIRAMLRDRQWVRIFGTDGRLLGEGTLEQAAQDFLTLGIHPRDEYARPRSLQGRLIIPYRAIAWIEGQTAK